MHSSTFNFERVVPAHKWPRYGLVTAVVVLLLAVGWEMYARSIGYGPTLNDTSDLWAMRRKAVQPDSLVIIGDSRAIFDNDLDALQQGLGKRPIQLALVGSCAYPVLENLCDDERFHGTIICSLLPDIFFAPAGPPVENSMRALKRYKTQTVSQWASEELAMPLEEHVAFLKQDDLTLGALIGRIHLPNRAGALLPPALPPYFSAMDRERRTRMFAEAEQAGPLQTRIREGWIPLFTPPPPPTYVPRDAFLAGVDAAMKARFENTVRAVHKLQARGGQVVFVRYPFCGPLKELEDKLTPREKTWDPLVKACGAAGVYFEDYPELSGFQCPEWSHLSGADSVEFTKRLVPHLKDALAAVKSGQ